MICDDYQVINLSPMEMGLNSGSDLSYLAFLNLFSCLTAQNTGTLTP